jgi:benzoyl-CoA reductase subunit B
VLESAKNRPSPIDAYFGGVYYIGPMFTAFRGTTDAVEYYDLVRKEIEQRIREGKGPITPEGDMKEEKYRLVVEGPPNWTSFREFWKLFYDEGAVVVASSYTRWAASTTRASVTTRTIRWARWPTTAWLLHQQQPAAARRTAREVHERLPGRWPADQLDQELQQLLGGSAADDARDREADRQAGGVHRDRPRRSALLHANVKNRLESYFQMVDQKRSGASLAAA